MSKFKPSVLGLLGFVQWQTVCDHYMFSVDVQLRSHWHPEFCSMYSRSLSCQIEGIRFSLPVGTQAGQLQPIKGPFKCNQMRPAKRDTFVKCFHMIASNSKISRPKPYNHKVAMDHFTGFTELTRWSNLMKAPCFSRTCPVDSNPKTTLTFYGPQLCHNLRSCYNNDKPSPSHHQR